MIYFIQITYQPAELFIWFWTSQYSLKFVQKLRFFSTPIETSQITTYQKSRDHLMQSPHVHVYVQDQELNEWATKNEPRNQRMDTRHIQQTCSIDGVQIDVLKLSGIRYSRWPSLTIVAIECSNCGHGPSLSIRATIGLVLVEAAACTRSEILLELLAKFACK